MNNKVTKFALLLIGLCTVFQVQSQSTRKRKLDVLYPRGPESMLEEKVQKQGSGKIEHGQIETEKRIEYLEKDIAQDEARLAKLQSSLADIIKAEEKGSEADIDRLNEFKKRLSAKKEELKALKAKSGEEDSMDVEIL